MDLRHTSEAEFTLRARREDRGKHYGQLPQFTQPVSKQYEILFETLQGDLKQGRNPVKYLFRYHKLVLFGWSGSAVGADAANADLVQATGEEACG